MVVNEDSAMVSASSDSRGSSNSRTSRSSQSSPRPSVGWYACCCCGGGGGSGGGGRSWSPVAPSKFYCCRADLVADMARQRGEQARRQQQNNNEAKPIMDDPNVDDFDEDFEFAEEALPDETFREVFDRSHQQDADEQWDVAEPNLPYVENLPHPLSSGRVIMIEGAVLPDADGFAVNLACGAGREPDLAFHFNPRLDRGYVARNSRAKGHWGEEENAALGGSPFKSGEPFVMHILVTATGFKVSVNWMHLCNFQFRMPLAKVCRLEVHGDVVLSLVKHTRLDVYPDRTPGLIRTLPTDHAVPWSIDLPKQENLFIGCLKPNSRAGIEITVKGIMKLLPQSFYINLQQGCQLWPHPNIHFHLNPRFAAENDEHIVIANTWLLMTWGSEQRYSRCRFQPGHPFSMVIYVEEDRYRVTVDGLQQAVMHHRSPPTLVDTLVVRGDLFVTHIGVAPSAPPAELLPTPRTPLGSSAGSPFGSVGASPTGSLLNVRTGGGYRTDSLIALSPDSRSLRSDSIASTSRDFSMDSGDLAKASSLVTSTPSAEQNGPSAVTDGRGTASGESDSSPSQQTLCSPSGSSLVTSTPEQNGPSAVTNGRGTASGESDSSPSQQTLCSPSDSSVATCSSGTVGEREVEVKSDHLNRTEDADKT